MISRQHVEAALADVYDPCSVQANAPLSLIDMGLVTRIEVTESGEVVVGIRPTSPWCTMIGSLMRGVEERIGQLDDVVGVTVEVDRTTDWSEADLTESGKRMLDGVRARSRAAVPVRRQQWRERVPTLVKEDSIDATDSRS
jgi:metal-sulfur cluster biosynthetic enzyme